MSVLPKITPEAIIPVGKERDQGPESHSVLDADLKIIREAASLTPVNPACSFESLSKLSYVDLHVNDTCTKCQPCGACKRMHKSDEDHPSNSSSRELTDRVVNKPSRLWS
jgi:hypothetical protein